MALTFQISYANVPFLLDKAEMVELPGDKSPVGEHLQPLLAQQRPLPDLVDEIDRLLPFRYLSDFLLPGGYPGRNMGGLAQQDTSTPEPNPQIRIGDWYYPYGACRWSAFRGLATSSMAKAMLDATGGASPSTFLMSAVPTPGGASAGYGLTSSMYMLPPRPLGEVGGVSFDGLYLITLVDERFYNQGDKATLRPTATTTWANFITQIASILGVTINVPTIDAVYSSPEPDSQFWTNTENASFLLDAIAYNLGRRVVRNLDGTYDLLSPTDSQSRVLSNRGDANNVIREAGGDIFLDTGTRLPVGNLLASKNAVVPTVITVSFPKYVQGNDPVPHFLNPRNKPQRPTAWYEESYGETHDVDVPIASGGPLVSGLTGTLANQQTIHTTAKALMSGEASPVTNSGNLCNLALQIARDRYEAQVASALDEVYPGLVTWAPEGIHDIIWTWSARSRQASTRVTKTAWNDWVGELQHATPSTPIVKGVGGPTVPQTIRDSYGASGTLVGTSTGTDPTFRTFLATTLNSGVYSTRFEDISYFPTRNRWRGLVDSEVVLFEGTSGGVTNNTVNVVYRGIDGTQETDHLTGAAVYQVLPNTSYGVNLTSYEPAQFTYPHEWTSGGITGMRIVPQIQTVQVVDGSGIPLNNYLHYSGVVNPYDPSQTLPWMSGDCVWVVDRNAGKVDSSGVPLSGQNPAELTSGTKYVGQLVGYSTIASGRATAAPVYAADVNAANPFLAQVTVKDYTGTVFEGGSKFIEYWWTRVSDTNDPQPILYSGMAQSGGPAPNNPAYHVQNLDVPVFPVYSGTQPHSIYRMWKGHGAYYLFDGPPWEDLFRRTADSDAYGVISFHRVYNQYTGLWMDGQEVRLILAS